METFPVDIDPGQLVRWVKAECEAAPSTLRVSGKRAQTMEPALRGEALPGEEEHEDLTEVETIATQEIAPAHASEGWLLSIVVEDELGPRVSEEGAGPEGEQSIDLGTFVEQFIRPGRGIANALVQVQDAAAKAHLTQLIEAIETNRHAKLPPAS